MHGNYPALTAQLVATLTADPRILGVVALDSMAERNGRKPDRWSDQCTRPRRGRCLSHPRLQAAM